MRYWLNTKRATRWGALGEAMVSNGRRDNRWRASPARGASAVLQKSADFDKSMHRVTLGKPKFDETSKKKAAASHDITLVEHDVFVEGLLRVHAGTLQPVEFLSWLAKSGVAEIERLGGTPIFTT
jgi:hypothetical protein